MCTSFKCYELNIANHKSQSYLFHRVESRKGTDFSNVYGDKQFIEAARQELHSLATRARFAAQLLLRVLQTPVNMESSQKLHAIQ